MLVDVVGFAPPSQPHYENDATQTGTDKQIAEEDRTRLATHESLNAKASTEKALAAVEQASSEIAQEAEALKTAPMPPLTPEAAAAAHRMVAHESETMAQNLIGDARKHAKEASAEATQAETTTSQAIANTDLKAAAEQVQEAGQQSVHAVALSNEAMEELAEAKRLLEKAKKAATAADLEMSPTTPVGRA
ncbi:uncharacterized protein LOC129618170 [Condylostylus longicornis]|uniref:uncharacterized protein LOC129618170 n=1 Tax=Condylostylus longicornis TaxID=2530218 RepID=UPI00244DEE87|nr:uncharacterized protein LOC129618170 [Condylostylus longicornis]